MNIVLKIRPISSRNPQLHANVGLPREDTAHGHHHLDRVLRGVLHIATAQTFPSPLEINDYCDHQKSEGIELMPNKQIGVKNIK